MQLLLRVYHTITGGDESLHDAAKRYTEQPDSFVKRLADVGAVIQKIDGYLAESLVDGNDELQNGNESSLDITMINEHPNEAKEQLNEFQDLEKVLDYQSKVYSDLEAILKRSLSGKTRQVEESKDDKEIGLIENQPAQSVK